MLAARHRRYAVLQLLCTLSRTCCVGIKLVKEAVMVVTPHILKSLSSPATHVASPADAGEASGDSTFLSGSGLDRSLHSDSAQAPGRGAEGSHDGGGIGDRVLMDTNKASVCARGCRHSTPA